jgi:hypothetical protein
MISVYISISARPAGLLADDPQLISLESGKANSLFSLSSIFPLTPSFASLFRKLAPPYPPTPTISSIMTFQQSLPPAPTPTSSTSSVSSSPSPSSDLPVGLDPRSKQTFTGYLIPSQAASVSLISFALGSLFSLALFLALPSLLPSFLTRSFAWWREGGKEGWTVRVPGYPGMPMYLASFAFFHLMEFWVTATYNPSKAGVDCTSPPLSPCPVAKPDTHPYPSFTCMLT